MLSKKMFLISCMMVSLFPGASFAEEEKTRPKAAPFLEIQDLFTSMRIPNIVVATDGTVLAFAKSGWVLRRSEDGGKSWGPFSKSALTPGAVRSSMRTPAM